MTDTSRSASSAADRGSSTLRAALMVALMAVIAAATLLLVGLALPDWLLFTMTKAAAFGLVALGIVHLMRGGLVSFGQGLV